MTTRRVVSNILNMANETDRDRDKDKDQEEKEQPPKLDRENPPAGYEKTAAGGDDKPEKKKGGK